MAIDATGARALADFKSRRSAALAGLGTITEAAAADAALQALIAAILAEITTYGVITVASVSAVQPGAGVSGPGTGTIA